MQYFIAVMQLHGVISTKRKLQLCVIHITMIGDIEATNIHSKYTENRISPSAEP